jgi:hypothetical protein
VCSKVPPIRRFLQEGLFHDEAFPDRGRRGEVMAARQLHFWADD